MNIKLTKLVAVRVEFGCDTKCTYDVVFGDGHPSIHPISYNASGTHQFEHHDYMRNRLYDDYLTIKAVKELAID